MSYRVAAPYQVYAGHLGKIMVFCLLSRKKMMRIKSLAILPKSPVDGERLLNLLKNS